MCHKYPGSSAGTQAVLLQSTSTYVLYVGTSYWVSRATGVLSDHHCTALVTGLIPYPYILHQGVDTLQLAVGHMQEQMYPLGHAPNCGEHTDSCLSIVLAANRRYATPAYVPVLVTRANMWCTCKDGCYSST